MAEILEIVMIVSFGASWPLNVIKSYKARTTKGKSLGFLLLIFFGYIAGIISKFVNEAYMANNYLKTYEIKRKLTIFYDQKRDILATAYALKNYYEKDRRMVLA